jgi:hypothetical protein
MRQRRRRLIERERQYWTAKHVVANRGTVGGHGREDSKHPLPFIESHLKSSLKLTTEYCIVDQFRFPVGEGHTPNSASTVTTLLGLFPATPNSH